ncbi:MAG TPA: hypothetical protein VJ892_03455 [Candidatus Absconditabacterales bacterium]|nr:hypothetical protein [Candidatus Absconditabacterales bacterium]
MLNKKNIDMSKEKKVVKKVVDMPNHIEEKLKGAKKDFQELSPKKRETKKN